MKLATLLATSIPFTLLAAEASALQTNMSQQWMLNQRQGMSSVSPAGLMVAGEASPVMRVRHSGVVTAQPPQWSTTRFGAAGFEMPDFSTSALLAGINRALSTSSTPPAGGTPATTLSLGGFSTGGDVCGPIQVDGKMSPGNSWYGLSVSVAQKASSTNYGLTGSSLRSLANGPGGIVTYYYDGSTGIDAQLVDSTVIEQTDGQLGFDVTDAEDLRGIDWGMGAIATDPSGTRSRVTAPVRDKLYFSVASDWLSDNPGHVVEFGDPGSTAWLPLVSDTVYVMSWDYDSTAMAYQWTSPEVAFSDDELFGSAHVTTHAIDALSVYVNGMNERVLFSVEGHALGSQIMGYDRTNFSPSVVAMPVTDLDGDLIAEKLGLDINGGHPDDVDGLCGLDPESGLLSSALGTPLERTAGSSVDELGIAVYRGMRFEYVSSEETQEETQELVDSLTVQVTGITPTINPGLLHIYLGTFDQASLPLTDFTSVSWFDSTWVLAPAGASTVSLEIPEDPGFSGELAFFAEYHLTVGGPVHRTSMISGLNY